MTDATGVDVGAHRDDDSRSLVSEDERTGDDVVTDASFAVIVSIRSAYTDSCYPNQDLVRGRSGYPAFFEADFLRSAEDAGRHRQWHR
ncbi:MAG: hypothetical protein ACJA07_002466 [Rhodococcus sp. (in: high G+C Gram-positive bacteria)]